METFGYLIFTLCRTVWRKQVGVVFHYNSKVTQHKFKCVTFKMSNYKILKSCFCGVLKTWYLHLGLLVWKQVKRFLELWGTADKAGSLYLKTETNKNPPIRKPQDECNENKCHSDKSDSCSRSRVLELNCVLNFGLNK